MENTYDYARMEKLLNLLITNYMLILKTTTEKNSCYTHIGIMKVLIY